ncbi:hypothetical protein [Streptomyces sp. V3I7]|uniref:hypothetical protein n=1 Tax=Streptomyces sp. V3I7 TaxID=3042278 RepID=UPI0027807220|nr:hypothetical protein [Streptomyces sp. V3I7]MDQ0992641.1 hypothetical protein [Streptomyces sp. V3I7]
MSLVDLIAQADERGLAASGLACLDRCMPLLSDDDQVLRPLWASLVVDGDWGGRLEKVRAALDATGPQGSAEDEGALLVRRMIDTAPPKRTADETREWADACSVAALRIHQLLDPAEGGTGPAGDSVDSPREGRTEGMSPLVAAELRRQTTVLELLAEHGRGGLRSALQVSTEGRRVLRAVVSRRARVRG